MSKRLNKLLIGIVAVVLLIPITVNRLTNQNAPPKEIELINGHDWSNFAGATSDSEGVHIHPLARAIVKQDGSAGQPNPPVNIRGPHIIFKNDVRIDWRALIPQSGTASFDLYSSVPIIYDEWRYEPSRVRINFNQKSITAYEWDGTGDGPVFTKTWLPNVGSDAKIGLDIHSEQLTVLLNGQPVGSLTSKRVFAHGEIWFGADASLDSHGWTLKTLSAYAQNGRNLVIASAPSLKVESSETNTLKNSSRQNPRELPIGAAMADYALFGDADYRKLAAVQFSLLTTENELKPQFVHPQPNEYSFIEADSLVEFAQINALKVHGHTLVFSEANPGWMQRVPIADRQRVMTEHITNVMRHYRNNINDWDVVDEPLTDDAGEKNNQNLRHNIWWQAMGDGYIDQAFRAARTANPSAKLYVNEYGLEQDGVRWDTFLTLVKQLKTRGVPIDGVGFQSHVYSRDDEIEPEVLGRHMQTLAALGLESRISEIDVHGENPIYQATQYADVMEACLSQPTCSSYTIWGISDKYGSTTTIHTYPPARGNDLPWNNRLKSKPAFRALLRRLDGR